MRHLLEEAFNNLIESNSKKPVKESQLQEFLGFGNRDSQEAVKHHESKARQNEELADFHEQNGDHKHAAAYRSAAEAHSAAAAAHKTVVDGAKSSKINRSSSNDRKAAEEASTKANSIQTPKPTKGATQKAVAYHVWRSDHYYPGSVPNHHYEHVIDNENPPTHDHIKTYLGKHWQGGEDK